MAEILKGAPVAAAITERLVPRVRALAEVGVIPTLAIIRAGERADDVAYENAAAKRCEKVGVRVRKYTLPRDVNENELLKTIDGINADGEIHACLMFRPLPDKVAESIASERLSPQKDVDGMTGGALARVFTGKGEGYPPCTAEACMKLLDHYGVKLKGKNVTVIGRSLVIGKPVAALLLDRDATVTVCHTKTKNLAEACKTADILVCAAGRAGLVDKSFLNPEQIVIDVAINADENGKLCGDVCFEEAEGVVKAITPVPAGVGSVTTAVLCEHVVEAAEREVTRG